MADTYITIEGDTVDAIAYAHYGRHSGTTEAVYEANRGLASMPLILPEGTRIVLPVLDEAEPIRTVKLYD
jgi:phage tail protein X